MSIEKFPNNHSILVPRSPEKGADPSTRKIEVWQTLENPHTTTADEIMTYSQSAIQDINPTTGKTELVHDSKPLKRELFNPQGQENLARELAQLPLRGDRVFTIHEGRLIEGTMSEYYEVEGVKYGSLIDQHNQQVGMFMDTLTPAAQAELAEAYSRHDVLEKGRVGLEAAEVADPSGPPMWSAEWSALQRQPVRAESIVDATAEKPYYFDKVRHGVTKTGRQVDVLAIYDDPEKQVNMLIISDPLDPKVTEHVPDNEITMLVRSPHN